MTRCEAIDQLESLLEHCKTMHESGEIWARDCEALGMAIAALHCPTRRQVERTRSHWITVVEANGREYSKCADCQNGLDGLEDAYLFCPNCGRPMTDEAVDIVMKDGGLTMIQIKQGSLLDAEETIIAHQVNCFGVAGGLAYHVFEKWPDAKNDYQQITMRSSQFMGGLENLLGMAQLTGHQPDGKIIANLFGQFRPGTDYQPDVLRRTLENLSALAKSLGASVAMPYGISCGICGGDWNEVRQIIEETMQGVDVALYKLDEQERKPHHENNR